MRGLAAVIVGIALGVGLVAGAATPASAASPAATTVLPMAAVTGESWSAPAYPVDCQASSGQVTCTPTNPASVTSMQCFRDVLYAGQPATVCTTFEGHTKEIQNAGGTATLVKYGCSLGDLVCVTFENAGRGMALAATGIMYLVASNMRFDTSTLLWTTAVGQWSFWQWAILIITFAAMVWAITAAIVSGDRSELFSALVRSFIAIPAVPLSLWLTGHLLNAVDEMTWYLVSRNGASGLFDTMQSVMWAGGQANYFFAFLIHGLLMIGMLLLMLVFAFRNIVLAALIAVGPVAWMLFPVRGIGPQWVVRYVSAVVALLLTGPLTIGFVMLIVNGLAAVKTIWNPQAWPLLVGLVLVAFAPFAIFSLFSFVGAVAADGVGSRLGAHGGRMAGNAARTASRIPGRLSGRPSGVSPTGRGSSASGPSKSASPTSSSTPTGASGPTQSRTGVSSTTSVSKSQSATASSPSSSSRTSISTSSASPSTSSTPRPQAAPSGAPADRSSK